VVVRFGHGDGLGRDGLLGEKSDLAAHLFHARFRKEQSAGSLRGLPAPRWTLRAMLARELTFMRKRASERMPLCVINNRDGDDGDGDDGGGDRLAARRGHKRERRDGDGDDARSQPGRSGCRRSVPDVDRRLSARARRSGSGREGRDSW
jgi:hypothetical protein